MARLGGIDSQYHYADGSTLSGGFLYFYETGTTTPKTTYTDSDYVYQNRWPIELDAAGVPPSVFFTGTAKIVLKDKDGNTIRTLDPVVAYEYTAGDAIVYRLGDIDSQFFYNDSSEPLRNGKIYIYVNGTSTPKTIYSDNALSTEADWPHVLDENGRIGDVFYEGKARLVLTDADGVQIRELDEVETFELGTNTGFVVSCPSGVTIAEGEPVVFCVDVDGDPAGYTYQWYKNLTAVSGATEQCFSFQVQASDDGVQVWVEVSDGSSTETCGYATLLVGLTGCTEWSNSVSSVTATSFWTSPTSENSTTYLNRTRNGTIMAVQDDSVYIQHGSNIVYTNDFGDNWTTVSLLDFMPVDLIWSDGEKTSATFGTAAWPNGYPTSTFSLASWKWVSGNLIACFNESVYHNGYIANLTTGDAIRTGFGYNCSLESSDLRENFPGESFYPPNYVLSFTYWDGELTVIGVGYESYVGDPYPQRHQLLKGGVIESNAVTLSEGGGGPQFIEEINGNIVFYGSWGGASGGGLATRYGYVDSTIQFGPPYTYTASWSAAYNTWLADTAATLQPSKTSIISTDSTYQATDKQRPAKWLASEKMFAGLVLQRYGTIYTNLSDGVKYDYNSERDYTTSIIFEIYPVEEKGAFIAVETNVSGRVASNIKISPTGAVGSFSTGVTFTLPFAVVNSNPQEASIYYSKTQQKFLYTYLDASGLIRVVQFDDPFTCATRE